MIKVSTQLIEVSTQLLAIVYIKLTRAVAIHQTMAESISKTSAQVSQILTIISHELLSGSNQ